MIQYTIKENKKLIPIIKKTLKNTAFLFKKFEKCGKIQIKVECKRRLHTRLIRKCEINELSYCKKCKLEERILKSKSIIIKKGGNILSIETKKVRQPVFMIKCSRGSIFKTNLGWCICCYKHKLQETPEVVKKIIG
jgi:hypothetical protein